MLSCEITEIIKNAYFEEHLRTIASGVNIFLFNIINLITSNDFSRPACQSCSSQKICCAITLFFLARQSPISQNQFLITLFFLFLKCHGSYKIIVDDSKCNIHNKILIDVLRQKVFLLNYRKIPFSGYLSKFNNLLMGLFGMLISICFVLISSYEIITENYF